MEIRVLITSPAYLCYYGKLLKNIVEISLLCFMEEVTKKATDILPEI